MKWKKQTLLAALLPLFMNTLHALPFEMGGSLFLGTRMDYGNNFATLNAPYGILSMNNAKDGADLSPISREWGISTEGQLRAIIARYYYVATGFEYVSGIKTGGKYLLRNQFSQSAFVSGTSHLPTNVTIQLSHLSIPIQAGLVVTFWKQLRLYSGLGFSWNKATQSITQNTDDKNTLDFSISSKLNPSFFAWHYNLMGEYLLIGSPEDINRLTINVSLQQTWGVSDVVNDSNIETNLPASLPLAANDTGSVDISGFRFSAGFTYYFIRSE